MMRAFLATILSVIAAGVLLIAYGLLSPRVAAAPGDLVTLDRAPYTSARPYYASDRVALPDDRYAPAAYAPAAYAPARYAPATYARPTAYTQAPVAPRRVVSVERAPRRDWTKTALVIGGSTAAGAGVGGIVGGGKGAAIGAALGGGVSTLFEALHK
jgi:hypothetical protein